MLKFKQILVFVVLVASSTSYAAFETPSSNANSWGGWARGDAGTMYAEWDIFETYQPGPGFAPIPDATPDVGSFNTTTSIVSVTSGTPIPVGSGNIYSPTSVLGWSLLMQGSEPTGPTQVALQVATSGSELDYANITLNGMAPTESRVELSRTAIPGLGDNVESLLLWDLVTNVGSYLFEFTGAASSVSLTNIAADIGSVAPVPLPAAAWMLLSGIIGMSAFGRSKKNL